MKLFDLGRVDTDDWLADCDGLKDIGTVAFRFRRLGLKTQIDSIHHGIVQSTGESLLDYLERQIPKFKSPIITIHDLAGIGGHDILVDEVNQRVSPTHRAEGNLAVYGGVGPLRKEGRGASPVPTFSHPGVHARVDRRPYVSIRDPYHGWKIRVTPAAFMRVAVGGHSILWVTE